MSQYAAKYTYSPGKRDKGKWGKEEREEEKVGEGLGADQEEKSRENKRSPWNGTRNRGNQGNQGDQEWSLEEGKKNQVIHQSPESRW